MFFKKTTLLVVLMSNIAITTAVFAEEKKVQDPKEYKGVVTYVVDGDRFILESDKETHMVRMKWVNAPDDGQPLADESHTFLNELIQGREVVVLSNGDNDGCLFGELIADGINYNHEMIRSGLAHTYKDAPNEYISSALNAKKEKRGVWSSEYLVEPNTAWKSISEYRAGCQVEDEIIDYKNESALKSGRETYRYLTTPFYLGLSFLVGILLWVGINRFDDPRIAMKIKRLERNKRELKEAKKEQKDIKQKSKELIEGDKESKTQNDQK